MDNIPYFDAHCDTVSLCAQAGKPLRQNPGHLDLRRLGAFSPAAQVFALFADKSDYPEPGSLWAHTQQLHDFFVSQLSQNKDICQFCRDGEDIKNSHARGLTAVLLSIEGGELLDCDPDRLETAKAWGVRCINLTWNHANTLSGSHKDAPHRGLSPQGEAFVRQADRLGIILDVSHLSDKGFWDLVNCTASPLLASHSNARALCPHSRNLTDEMFQAICRSGGVAGINYYTDFVGGNSSLEAVADHIDHFIALGGAKHIALGGDWDGCDRLAGDMTGVQDIPRLWDALTRRGYSQTVLEDIFYNNLKRVLG
jgi:membrane dipeptidase